MKRAILEYGFVGLMVVMALNLIGCSPTREVHAVEQQLVVVGSGPTEIVAPLPANYTAGHSCANPTPEMAPGCELEAQRILASTVRLELHGISGGIGHGTVIGGRYLITHNHYPATGAILRNGGEGMVTAVSVLKANGDVILLNAPLSYFTVLVEEPEMLVLDFQAYSGVGFFDSLGVPSAELRGAADPLPRPGNEVAQVDWDGTAARVIWARVTVIQPEGGLQSIELDTYVQQGASGGGIFYNGVHIANNWSRNIDRLADTGEIVRQYSVAALNTPQVAAMGNY